MKKKYLILPVLAMVLVGCRKTDESFEAGRYNSSDFDQNYYMEWNEVDKVQIGKVSAIHVYSGSQSYESIGISNDGKEYGFAVRNLINEEDKFSYGYLSKLYDGRLRCDGLTTRSRVQLNKTGYGTFFPKEYRGSESFAFALRGGTTINYPSEEARIRSVVIEATFKFYIRQEGTNVYDRVDLIFDDLKISSDNGGSTTYIEMPFDEATVAKLYGADAMSFEFSLNDLSQYSGYNITDDFTSDPNKEKEHFSIMLYEVLLPGSVWY